MLHTVTIEMTARPTECKNCMFRGICHEVSFEPKNCAMFAEGDDPTNSTPTEGDLLLQSIPEGSENEEYDERTEEVDLSDETASWYRWREAMSPWSGS